MGTFAVISAEKSTNNNFQNLSLRKCETFPKISDVNGYFKILT